MYGVLLTMVDPKRSHAQRVVATVRHSLKGKVPVFETQIVQNFAYKEAAEVGRTILEFQSRGQAADEWQSHSQSHHQFVSQRGFREPWRREPLLG